MDGDARPPETGTPRLIGTLGRGKTAGRRVGWGLPVVRPVYQARRGGLTSRQSGIAMAESTV